MAGFNRPAYFHKRRSKQLAKYKVGDMVRVKSLEELKKNYLYIENENEKVIFEKEEGKDCPFIGAMYKYCGNIISIDYIYSDGDYKNKNIRYTFADWMLEDVVEEIKTLI